jgi:hypothetical protein
MPMIIKAQKIALRKIFIFLNDLKLILNLKEIAL